MFLKELNKPLAGAEALLKEGEVQAETGRDADFAMRASEWSSGEWRKQAHCQDGAIKYVEGWEAWQEKWK